MLIQSEYRVHNKNDKSVLLPTMTILKTVELNPLPVMKMVSAVLRFLEWEYEDSGSGDADFVQGPTYAENC